MFSSDRLFIQIGSHDFRYVVDAVPGRVGISLECVKLFMFGYLCDKSFEGVFAFGFIF